MAHPSPLSAFGNMLVRFFEELQDTFPEERDIKLALKYIQDAKKINPRLILELFTEHVTGPLREFIAKQDEQSIIVYARTKMNSHMNEIMPALAIFDKHWSGLSDMNRDVIWKYLKVLVALGDKAQGVRV
jgi:hypothetical protein